MYCMTTHPGVAQNRKKDQRSSIFRDGKQCLSNSPEISGITFILLFYFIIMFLKVFLTGAYPDSILLTFTIKNRSYCVNYVLIISMWYVRPAKPQISLRICAV